MSMMEEIKQIERKYDPLFHRHYDENKKIKELTIREQVYVIEKWCGSGQFGAVYCATKKK